MRSSLRSWKRFGTFVALVIVLGSAGARAQSATPQAGTKPESIAGTYDGTAVGPDGSPMSIRVELKYGEAGFTGFIDAPTAQVSILGGGLEADLLTLTIDAGGMSGTLRGRVAGRKIEGSWSLGEMGGTFTIERPEPARAADSAGDPISGAWAGEAYVQGQAMPFTLTMKLTGETVIGDVESAMGKVPLTGGTWKDGTLLITFPYVGGEPVSMGGQLKYGKLEGIVDYNTGELQGTWIASKK